MRACGGLHRQYLAEPLLTYMSFKSRLQAFAVKLVAGALVGEKGHEASDSIGTLHVAHWVPFENNHIGFFTVFDGDFEKYFQDFADKTSFVFDAALSTCRWRRRQPQSQRTLRRSISGRLDNNYPAIGFYSAYPGLSVQDIRALLADRKSQSATAG